MKIYYIVFLLLISSIFGGCSKWLDVKPSDRVTEENTFSTPQSFKQALNGIYIELNKESIYGKTLTTDFIDILGQYYKISVESVNNYELLQYNYSSVSNRSKIEAIWATNYNLIANTNRIILNAEKSTNVLAKNDHDLIYGEALALRALLHFDLFRLFGPVFTKGSTTLSIPYYTDVTLNVNSSMPAQYFVDQVISDLTKALEYLQNDPVITNGGWSKSSEKFNDLRVFRLNYYAVKGLLARVYMYADEKEKALEVAKEIIAIQESKFPWVTTAKYLTDKTFSTEVLFGLQNIRRRDIYTSLFDLRSLNEVYALAPLQEVVLNSLFQYDNQDFRLLTNANTSLMAGLDSYRVFEKYSAEADSLENQLVPLIRVSEMYYIAAECEPIKAEALKYIQKVRNKRGIPNGQWDSADFPSPLIQNEYRREFWGEGQLFFYYKRKKLTSIPSALSAYGTVQMNMNNYVLPIPDGETKYN